MRLRLRVIGLALGLTLAGAGSAAAQVAWDSPMLMVPRGQTGLGLFLMEAAGGDLGFMGTWRAASGRGLGLRIGIAEDNTDDIAVFGGVDFASPLTRASNEFPLDVDWVLGAGASVGDDFVLSIPAGITVGRTLDADGARFVPYATPRVILDAFFGDGDDELELDVAVDLGVELAFERAWAIRFGATLGDRDALAIGIVF
ncbi:MAG TPA: hypothetical protein VF212_10820 [Longimicrobiales bacterium]